MTHAESVAECTRLAVAAARAALRAATSAYVSACETGANAKSCDDAHYSMCMASQANARAIAADRAAYARVEAERKAATFA